MPTHFEEIGGEPKLRALVESFIDKVVSDTMIGFFFRGVDRTRLAELEYQFAAGHLGAGLAYQGRPLQAAHARHPILGGQFNRRLSILRKVLVEAQVPQPIIEAWIAHNESLRHLITGDDSSECNTERAAERALAARKKAQP